VNAILSIARAALRLGKSPEAIQKTTFFATVGAVGCLLGAVLGEPLYGLIPGPRAANTLGGKVDILFVLDATSSMQPLIDGVRDGIVEFARKIEDRGLDERIGVLVFRDELEGEESEPLMFDGSAFTSDSNAFRQTVGTVSARGGGDTPESSYDALRLAASQPFREDAARVLLLITDAPPLVPDRRTRRPEEVVAELQQNGISQLHLVIDRNDRQEYAPLQAHCPGEIFDLSRVGRGRDRFDSLLPEVGARIAEATVRGLASTKAVDTAYAPRQFGITALWTGLLAVGVALALIAGQNHYLRKPLLNVAQMLTGVGGGLAVGSLAGGIGQALGFVPQLLPLQNLPGIGSSLAFVLTLAAMILGWAFLGGLLGRGLAVFVPNMEATLAAIGGVAGGTAASVAFLAASSLAGDVPGRLLGAALLGASIGAMLALVEVATRDFFLEVRYGQRELVTVNLGGTPVTVGCDGRCSTVFAQAAPRPISYAYSVANGQVQLVDYVTERSAVVAVGDERSFGSVTLTVRSGSAPGRGASGGQASPAAAPPPPLPPPPPRGASANSSRPTVASPQPAKPRESTPVAQERRMAPPPPPPPPPARS
jgi:Ca-activated chloride channel family protein